jgi:hypothetical protein
MDEAGAEIGASEAVKFQGAYIVGTRSKTPDPLVSRTKQYSYWNQELVFHDVAVSKKPGNASG